MPGDEPRRKRTSIAGVAVPYLVTVFVLLTVNFLLPRAMPGDPVQAQLSAGSPTYVYDDQARAHLAAYYGLDRPLVTQYARYMSGLLHGDLGVSTSNHTPVSKLLRDHLPWSLLLGASGIAIATAVGFLAGVHAGWRRERRSDRSMLTFFVAVQNVPPFVLASLALLALAVQLHWFPLGQARTPFQSLGPAQLVADVARHLVLPSIVVAADVAAYQFLLTRAGVVSELGADYLVLGRVKGLRERRLKYGYAARNAVLPVVSNTAVQMGITITTAVFVERVFAYPGIGNLMFESIGGRDYPVLQGCFLAITLLVLTCNVAADLIYRWLDPRAAA